MTLKMVKGQPGLLLDTDTDKCVNIRDIPLAFGLEACFQIFSAMVEVEGKSLDEAQEALAASIVANWGDDRGAPSPSWARGAAQSGRRDYLLLLSQRANDASVEAFGDYLRIMDGVWP
jgi:hypothetical protein